MTAIHKTLLFCLLLFFAGCTSPGDKNAEKPPLSEAEKHEPENAIRGLTVADGLQIGLFAHEPMLTNPTDMDIDEKGRVWVCEGYNYRNQVNPQDPYKKEGDRIVVMEDTTGDGVADKETVFYQGTDIDAALGIAVLGNKVIVSCSPNVFVFTDEDGDGKADKKDTLFTAIGGHQHDHAIHSFNFGPDGKLYFNFGNQGQSIRDKYGKEIRDRDGNIVNNTGHPYREGMVFRCNPDGSEFEVLGNNFRNNYEVAEDSYGSLWQSDNDDDGNRGVRINYVMPYGNYGYTDEMTGASWGEHRINMEDSIPYRHWHLNDPGVVPNLLQTGAGAPTGILIYEGDLLPERFRNQIIHADAGPNVVRSYAVSPDGAGYKAVINNIVQGTGDNWFRPSDVCIAPDGSLFISDWYDPGVGGHQVKDLNRGRVFRITTKDHRKYQVPALDLSTPAGAAKALQSPNLSTRYLAWEKLHGWGDQAIPALEEMYHTSPNIRFRARALWLLSKIPGKGLQYAKEALKDTNANIRITALRAGCELHGDTTAMVRTLVNDPSMAVKRAAAVALHHCRSGQAPELWATLAAQYDGRDRWYLEALGIGADGQWDADFAAWLRLVNNNWNTAAGRDIIWRSRAGAALPLLAAIIKNPANNPLQHLKFFRAFHFHTEPAKQTVLLSLLDGNHPQQNIIDEYVLLLLDPAKTPRTPAVQNAINNGLAAAKGSREYIEIVDRFHLRDKGPELMELAVQGKDRDMQADALKLLLNSGGEKLIYPVLKQKNENSRTLIRTLGDIEDKKTKTILQNVLLDKQYSLDWRMNALQAMGKDWTGEDMLLALQKNKKLPADLQDSAGAILAKSNRDAMRTSAAKYFKLTAGNIHTIEPIDRLVRLKGNATAGKTVFATYCASCHQVNNTGVNFGPNLSEIGSKLSKEALYAAVLTPSAGISFGFDGYIFKLKNGVQLLGYTTSETGDEVSIKIIGGITEKHKKTEIAEKKPYGRSLMTEGLPQAMGQDKFVDLVEYLATLKKKN